MGGSFISNNYSIFISNCIRIDERNNMSFFTKKLIPKGKEKIYS